jgi:hypothetical protein
MIDSVSASGPLLPTNRSIAGLVDVYTTQVKNTASVFDNLICCAKKAEAFSSKSPYTSITR